MKIIKLQKSRKNSINKECSASNNKDYNYNVAMKCFSVLSPLVKKGEAVGLACNQIGITNARIFLAVINNKIRYFINPVITKKIGNDVILKESCLSINKKSFNVSRNTNISLEYINIDTPKAIQFETFYDNNARIIQHEMDHLNGITISDRSIK